MAHRQQATRRLEARPGDVALKLAQLQETPLFQDASPGALRRLDKLAGPGAVVLRRYLPGDVVIQQGAPGWTAFYLLGHADLARLGLTASGEGPATEVLFLPGQARPEPAPLGWWERLVQSVYRRPRRYPAIEAVAQATPREAGAVIAHISEGELLGELSCFNHAPRSATVRALREVYAIEMMRNVLEIALENDAFRQTLDQTYRRRVLNSALTLVPLFEGAPPEALAALKDRVELVSFAPGQVVYERGQPADAVYFVRSGTLQTQASDGQRVLSYVSRGESLGLDAVLSEAPHATSCRVYAPPVEGGRRRGAARGRGAELIRISAALVWEMVRAWPSIADAAERLAEEASPSAPEGAGLQNLAGALGLVQAERVMLIDLDLCTRCDDCVTACAATHGGVSRLRREGPRFGALLVPQTCRQCLDPTCMVGCPVGSIHRGDTGEIVIEDWCIGCGLCSEQCPYDAIEVREEQGRRRAVTCDQCASLGGGTPVCVDVCGAGAATRVDGRAFFGALGESS